MTSASSARVRPRKGPPLPVRTMRSTASGRTALHRLENGAVFAIDGQQPAAAPSGQLRHQRPGHDQRFLVGHGDGLAGFQGGPGAEPVPPRRRWP